MLKRLQEKNTQIIAAYICMFAVLSLSLLFNLIPTIIAGLLAFVLSKDFLEKLKVKLPNNTFQEKLVGLIVGFGSLGALSLIVLAISKTLSGENISDLINTIAQTLTNSKQFLPPQIADYIPDSINEIKQKFILAFKEHVSSFADFGKGALHSLFIILVGWLIGILVACKKIKKEHTPFSKTWFELWLKLSDAFRFVVFAQVKVALFNSICMAIFLFVVSPLLGWDIPYSKILVLITFICGLIPIVGNLISNTITFIVSMTVSLPAAIAALVMLIVIHKLEYFIISKSLGADIDSGVWEILIVLFSFEILFGLSGMVFSPIIYVFFKQELRRINWLQK